MVSGWEIAYNQLFSAGEAQGDKPIVLSYASSPAATPGTSALLDSCWRQVEYVGILKGTDNLTGARKLVDFMLSPTVQEVMDEFVDLVLNWSTKKSMHIVLHFV